MSTEKITEVSISPKSPSSAASTASDSNDDEEDYFIKFNSFTGWQSVLLLQFQSQMTVAIMIGIFVAYTVCTIDAAFVLGAKSEYVEHTSLATSTIYTLVYAFDLFYLIDLICMILYKKTTWRVSMHYRSRNGIILAIEFISVVPIDMIYKVIIYRPNTVVYYCLRLRYALRLCRMCILYKDAAKYVGDRSHVIHLLVYFSCLYLVVVTVGCVSYVHKCYRHRVNCTHDNYLEYIGIAMYHSGAVFSLIGATGFLPHFSLINNISFALISYIVNIYFIGFFTCDIMQTLKIQFAHLNTYTWYSFRINQWKMTLQSEWKSFHRKYEMLVSEYGNLIWTKTRGHLPELYLGKILPPIMYREILLDISWVPLKHTHLFRNEDVAFLRAVAGLMIHKFFSPGEVVYKRNKYKGAMIYIISGVIQILSEEDCETPIITLTCGSILGESTLFVGYTSCSTAISKDVCEVAILYRKDFIKMSKLYPDKYKKMFDEILLRYEEAKFFRQISVYQFTVEYEKISILAMKWLKLTLRTLLYDSQKLGDLHNKYFLARLEKNVFCAKYLDLVVKANDYKLVADSVFIKNTFPFIFKEDSILLKMWTTFVLMLSIVLAITYPYFFVFSGHLSVAYVLFFIMTTFMWGLDLYIRSSTAISTKYDSHTTVVNIIVHNLTTCGYLADLVAALTPEVLFYMVNGWVTMDIAKYVCANRLLKIYKIHRFFTTNRRSTRAHICIKYLENGIYLTLLVYYAASVMFLIAHANEKTALRFQQFMQPFNATLVTEKLFLCCFAVIEYYGNLAFVRFPYMTEVKSFVMLLFVQMALFSINLFCMATVISMETLSKQSRRKMNEFINNIDITMQSYNLNRHLKERVWRYISLQFEISDIYFIVAHQSMRKLPHDLYVMTCGIKISRLVKNHQLFFEYPDYILAHIGTVATIHLQPATEVIKYVGEVCTEIHLLIHGFCLMKRHDGLSKIVEPGECFSVLEANLKIPSLVTVTALTNCKIVTIGYQNFKSVLLHYPIEYNALEDTIKQFPYWEEIKKMQCHGSVKRETIVIKYQQPSVYTFGYRLKKRTKKAYEFHEGFPKWAFFLKYVLMRYTFHSNGKWVLFWEITRCAFAIAVCILYPMTCMFTTFVGLHWVILCLDLTACIDLYVRHHFTYFNESGIEVTHPYKTARHYWRRAFLVDFLACIPIDGFISLVFGVTNRLPFYLNRSLQLYRVRGLYKHIFRNNMKGKGIVLMVEIFIFVIIIVNILTGFCFSYFCRVDERGYPHCLEKTWIWAKPGDKYQKYFLLLFVTVSGLSFSGFHKIQIETMTEIYYIMSLLIVGYPIYHLIIAKVVATSLTINRDLMSYQERLQFLVNYLGYKRIDKGLKQELVNHFEYMWYKTKGKSVHRSFEPFKTSFKVEALYNIYGTAFKDSNIFPAPNESFFKSLLIDTSHEIYLKTGIIYSVNDISGYIFLLLRGRVAVIGADGNRLTNLHIGSIFGNLDDCPLGRRTLKMVASGHVEVLRFSSTIFHGHLSKFPILKRRFDKLTIFNVDYLEETRYVVQVAETNTEKIAAKSVSGHVNILLRRRKGTKIFLKHALWVIIWESVILNIVCFVTYVCELFHMSTQDNSIEFTIVLYILDLFFVIKIYLKFHTSYEDLFGRIIKKRGLIALRYMQTTHMFYYDLFTIVPFELLSLLFLYSPYHRLIWALCRFNRLFRIIMVLAYLNRMTQKLNINVFIIRSLFLLVCVVLAQITMGAILTGLMSDQYKKDLLMQSIALVETETTAARIFCFIHFIQAITNTSAKIVFDITQQASTTKHALLFVIAILYSKTITIFFIAQFCSILHVVTHTRNNFGHFIIFMKDWMYIENVSLPLAERLCSYMNLLWNYNKGNQYPELLDEAPYYLKEAVLNSMFGFNLLKHPVLRHCHKDLMRQMTFYFRTLIFFPGDVIVYMGDIDNCMYFIQEGEVHALSEDTMYSEVVVKIFGAGEMFGFRQGLYDCCGHEYTYKVTKFTVVAYLNRESWMYLLDFYPASKYVIYKFGQEIE